MSDIIAAMSTQTGRSTVVLRGHLYKVGVLQDGRMSIDPIDPVKDSQAARAWTLWPEFLDLELCVLIYVLFFVVFALWRPAWLGDLNQWLRRTWASAMRSATSRFAAMIGLHDGAQTPRGHRDERASDEPEPEADTWVRLDDAAATARKRKGARAAAPRAARASAAKRNAAPADAEAKRDAEEARLTLA